VTAGTPVVSAMNEDGSDFTGTDAADLIASRRPFVLSTVIESEGSTSALVGRLFRFVVNSSKRLSGISASLGAGTSA
jgi:hypothetical protein